MNFILFVIELCPLTDGMSDPTQISDEQISVFGDVAPESDVSDIRPDGNGLVVKTKNSEGQPPSVTIALTPPGSSLPPPVLAYVEIMVSVLYFLNC